MISASLLILLASCQKGEIVESKISFSSGKVMQVDLAAQTVSVTIESGSSWTLSGEYDWITPSATSGKSGDKITFTLALNTTGKIRAAVYEIKADNLTEQLVVKQIGGKIDVSMTLAVADYSDNYVTVTFNLDADDLDLFNSWGLCYSETENPEEGTDIVLEGVPVKGTKDITINNLVTDQTYNVWSWLENEDGVRIYNDTKLEATAKAFTLEYTTPSLYSREFKTTMTVPMPCAELGICWNETGNPTVDDDHVCKTDVTSLSIDLNSCNDGVVLKPETAYTLRPYIVKSNGDLVYGEEYSFTTKKDPFAGWWAAAGSDNAYKINKFNALSELGPFIWGSMGKMNANAGTSQETITNALISACTTAWNETFRYTYLLFTEDVNGDKVMKFSIYTGSSDSAAKPKGSLVFTWKSDDVNGHHTFEYAGPASKSDPINTMMQKAGAELQTVIDYFETTTFYFEFCSANIDNLTSQYSGIKMKDVNNPATGIYEYNIMNVMNPIPVSYYDSILKQDENGNYILKNVEHWEQFCELTLKNRYASAVMVNDIDLGDSQAKVCWDDAFSTSKSWCGTFDGQGHTLTYNYVSQIGTAKQHLGPFFSVGTCTIKNLHVKGTILTNGERPGGLVAYAKGNCVIENCWVSTKITQIAMAGSNVRAGGIVGANAQGNYHVTLRDCVFDGQFTATTTAKGWAGIVGYAYKESTTVLENCLFAPSVIDLQSTSSSYCFVSKHSSAKVVKIDNCYYTKKLGSADGGSSVSADEYSDGTLAEALNAGREDGPWVVKDGKTVLDF